MKKRVIYGITAAVMLAGMLSGCGSETKTDVGTMTNGRSRHLRPRRAA